jgi:HK97 family phage major capsid protein
MVDAGSSLIWQPNAREAVPQSIFGIPLTYNQRSPILGSKGDLVLADLSYYLIKDGSGPIVSASQETYYTTNRTLFKIVWNVDGQPWLKKPIPLEKSATSLISPFVALNA